MSPPALETIRLPDGYECSARWWRVTQPRGAVLYLHGIQSHGGWYETSGSLLAERGFTVLMPDRRGSGLNRESRGHADSAQQLLDDGFHILKCLRDETGIVAAHLVGISWGGKLVAAMAAARPDWAASLSLVGPGIFARIDLSTAEKFRVAMAFINDRARMFPIPLNEARLFTANPERMAFVENDRLKLVEVSASFLLASRNLDRAARKLASSHYAAPVHVLLAGKDKIIDNEATRRWVGELRSPDRLVTEYADGEHTLEFEADPSGFYHDFVSWIEKHSTAASLANADTRP